MLCCCLCCLGFAVIDRSGKHFGVVLNYLRDGDVALPESQRDLQELLAEAEYYRVEGLITGIQAQMRSKNDPKPRCNFCYASSHEEAEELAASESKVSDPELCVSFNNS